VYLPDEFNPTQYDEGVYFLAPESTGSWTQRIWVNLYGTSQTHMQFRIATNPGDANYPQLFESFRIRPYGSGTDLPWTVNTGSYLGVDDALMWATGPSAAAKPYIWLEFAQGDVDNYPNPYNSTWSDTPEFMLQMQVYGIKGGEFQRLLNVEFYFDGEKWDDTTSVVDLRSHMKEPGYVHDELGYTWAPPAWTLNEPIPEPGSIAIWSLIGLSFVGAGVWRRRRAKCA
jgi:hypothetical protein